MNPIRPFFKFGFAPIAGFLFAFWLYSISGEQAPLSSRLTSISVYMITFLIVVGVHLILWLILGRGSFYNFKQLFVRIVRDTLIINAVMLSTLAIVFLWETFI